jgi:hypothetical protein
MSEEKETGAVDELSFELVEDNEVELILVGFDDGVVDGVMVGFVEDLSLDTPIGLAEETYLDHSLDATL